MNDIKTKEEVIQNYTNKIERSRYNIIDLYDRIESLEESILLYENGIEEEKLKIKTFEEYVNAINQ
jgi:hypothetical protein